MSKQTQRDQEALISDLQDVLEDTESMLKDVAGEAGDKAKALHDRIAANLRSVKDKLVETEQLVADKAKVAARATDDYVHENPWQSIGVAAGVGFLLGLLVSRR